MAFAEIISGAALGLSAAVIPGPLFALIVSETLRHGRNTGFKVSIAPLLTDAPIMLLSIFLLSRIASSSMILGLISVFGALFMIYLAYKNFTIKKVKIERSGNKNSLLKGIITNFLNPNPYIFWMTVGAPLVLYSASPLGFVLSLYSVFILANFAICIAVSKTKLVLNSRMYLYAIKLLGVVLLYFAYILLFSKGFQFLS